MNILIFLRQFRLGPFAIFDVAASFFVAYLLAPFLTKLFKRIRLSIPRKSWMFFTVPISILVHISFRVDTPLTAAILSPNEGIAEKIVIITLIVLGARHMKVLPA